MEGEREGASEREREREREREYPGDRASVARVHHHRERRSARIFVVLPVPCLAFGPGIECIPLPKGGDFELCFHLKRCTFRYISPLFFFVGRGACERRGARVAMVLPVPFFAIGFWFGIMDFDVNVPPKRFLLECMPPFFGGGGERAARRPRSHGAHCSIFVVGFWILNFEEHFPAFLVRGRGACEGWGAMVRPGFWGVVFGVCRMGFVDTRSRCHGAPCSIFDVWSWVLDYGF